MSSRAIPEKYRNLRSFAFGDGPELADELLDLVLKGVKTATCSTEDEPNISTPGECWIVRDGRGTPRCVIETTEISFWRYGDVDAAFAHDEGEGDRSLAYWRSAHRRYFTRLGKFSEDMMLMCERFRLVEIFATANGHALPPLPLAGEGRGGGLSASEASMAGQNSPTWKVSSKLRSNARALRKNSTDAERILWLELRGHRLIGASFRRQVPLKNYIADFVCHTAKLVIELDGGQHFSDQAEQTDASRSAEIEGLGFKVLRFGNHDVMANRAGVLETIATAIAERAPSLALPRKRERGRTEIGASTSRLPASKRSLTPSAPEVGLPLPLAGEGWGGGLSASEVSMAESKDPTWKVSSKLRSNARALRKNSTDAERILWSELRGHRLNGASFRRQVPIDNYITDFMCHEAKLVIEIDGGQHFSHQAEQADNRRSAVIEAKGFQVLRFSNLDIMTNRAGVLETIATAIAERAPSLTLPRKRERGQEKQRP